MTVQVVPPPPLTPEQRAQKLAALRAAAARTRARGLLPAADDLDRIADEFEAASQG